MNQQFDPRERLVQNGQKLLDAIYRKDQFDKKYAEQIKVLKEGNPAAMEELVHSLRADNEFTDFFVGALTIEGDRDIARREYVMLRETIEAMESRPDLPVGLDHEPNQQ